MYVLRLIIHKDLIQDFYKTPVWYMYMYVDEHHNMLNYVLYMYVYTCFMHMIWSETKKYSN